MFLSRFRLGASILDVERLRYSNEPLSIRTCTFCYYLFEDTRMCSRSAPYMVAPAGGFGRRLALPYGLSAHADKYLKFCFPWSY